MLKLEVDVSDIAQTVQRLEADVLPSIISAIQALAVSTHAHVLETAQNQLGSTREQYVNALGFKQVNESTFVVTLDRSAFWIEDGIPPNTEMIDWLLRQRPGSKSGPKTAKDGCVLNPKNKVLTSLGWKKIKDVNVGDLVLTHSGKFREVKAVVIQPNDVGSKFVTIYPRSIWKSDLSKNNHDLTRPTLSLTPDHLVLTKNGWVEAKDLKRGDWIATPSDKNRKCLECGDELPINCYNNTFCINNKCARVSAMRDGKYFDNDPIVRSENGKRGNKKAKEMGIYDDPNWGSRDPSVLKKLRDASSKAMREKTSSGKWAPEVFFESKLSEFGIDFERERPILTDRMVKHSSGKMIRSTLFIDFFIPSLNLAIELDGKRWHDNDIVKERDLAKELACQKNGYKLIRIPSHEIYKKADEMCRSILTWMKNHSGELGIAWVKVMKIKHGTINRKDHMFAKKYDLCLDAEEHSFCCETVFIHNSVYRTIPFKQNKAPTGVPKSQIDLQSTIKEELKKRKIPYGKLERNPDGSPKLGLLHSFDIMDKPTKTHQGPGQGWGEIGKVRTGATGIPLLQGVRIYQREIETAKGEKKTIRDIMTFRTVSSKMKGTGRWTHPGLEPKRFLDEGFEWAKKEWERILPTILEKL